MLVIIQKNWLQLHVVIIYKRIHRIHDDETEGKTPESIIYQEIMNTSVIIELLRQDLN